MVVGVITGGAVNPVEPLVPICGGVGSSFVISGRECDSGSRGGANVVVSVSGGVGGGFSLTMFSDATWVTALDLPRGQLRINQGE